MTPIYPFSAIVGQDRLKKALLLCGINPGLGGVLIRGDKGAAKSTAARGLAAILPPVQRIEGCAFNCSPGNALDHCEVCKAGQTAARPSSVPFVNLPLGATEDRVLGSLDLERALQDGKQAFRPGLLAAAHRGILYIDEVNLLADHLVDALLDVAAMGVNTVEREGMSIRHPARVTLVGTMNLEEGDLRPQLLDRFGMMVEVEASKDPVTRAEVVRRRLAFEADQEAFIRQWQPETDALRDKIRIAQNRLSQVTLSDNLLLFISRLCCEFEVTSLRADLVLNKAARAIAALNERDQVTAEDVREAAELVLPHRRRRKPFEQTGIDQEKLGQLMRTAPPTSNAQNGTPDENKQNNAPSQPEDSGSDNQVPDDDTSRSDGGYEKVFNSSEPTAIGRIEVDARVGNESSGRRSTSLGTRRGHYARAMPSENPTNIAVDATLRHALMRNPQSFRVDRSDLHEKVRIGKNANLIIMVVDASGSMAALRRMEMVKGAVLGLLQDAYQRRDEVAVIAFQGERGQLVLPPTRHVEQAERALRELPTGGRTPLAHALQLATEVLDSHATPNALKPLLVILSDGKGNVALSDKGDPWQQTLTMADSLAHQGIPALVLDTEQGFVRMGLARQLAETLQAEYLPMDNLSSGDLALIIRERLVQ